MTTNRRSTAAVGLAAALAGAMLLAAGAAQAQNKVKLAAAGEVFIDRNGDTLQITRCKGEGEQTECMVRIVAASGKAPIDPSGRFWFLSTLQGSSDYWLNNGGDAYAGPPIPLPGAAPAATAAPAAAAPVEAPTATPPTAPIDPLARAGGAAGQCPRTPYGGPVSGQKAASPALFQAKIADAYTQQTRAPYWYGVTFESFTVGGAIRNTVSNQPGVGATRVNNGAPANVMMYPVKSTHVVCEQSPGQSERRRVVSKYLCFVSADQEWTCGGDGLPNITQLR